MMIAENIKTQCKLIINNEMEISINDNVKINLNTGEIFKGDIYSMRDDSITILSKKYTTITIQLEDIESIEKII